MNRGVSTRAVALALTLASAPCGQTTTLNCTVLAHVDKFPGAVAPAHNYTGVWGMVGSDNREYAFVAARTGTIVYDCTVPTAPVEVAFIPGPAPASGFFFWREARSFGNYLYVSSEHGPVQVVDLTNPQAPVLVGTTAVTAHALSIDAQRKHLWLDGGAGNGAWVYDLGANPTNPPLITAYTPSYVHDSFVQNGWAYLSIPYEGKLRILDVNNVLAPVMRANVTTPGNFTHSVWVDDEDKICVVTDENKGGCLSVWDVTTKTSPQLRSTWCSPSTPPATLHYQFLRDKVVHMASYSDGYWAVDVSDPANPQAVAHFDTSLLSGNDYVGAWGCYPFQPSGVVYISDMQTGFWILQPTCGVPAIYGPAAAGKGGFMPVIEHLGGAAKVGNPSFTISGRKMLGGTTAALLVGAGATTLPILGITLLVDPILPNVLLSTTTTGAQGAPGVGTAQVVAGLPNDPALAGVTIYSQWIVLDPSGPGGMLASSRGMGTSICP